VDVADSESGACKKVGPLPDKKLGTFHSGQTLKSKTENSLTSYDAFVFPVFGVEAGGIEPEDDSGTERFVVIGDSSRS
jgi:hypothetical protein